MKTIRLPGNRVIALPTLYGALAVCLGTGLIATLLALGHFGVYRTLALPPLAPPAPLFGVVWTVLYALMAVSLLDRLRKPLAHPPRRARRYRPAAALQRRVGVLFLPHAFLWSRLLGTVHPALPSARDAGMLPARGFVRRAFTGSLSAVDGFRVLPEPGRPSPELNVNFVSEFS